MGTNYTNADGLTLHFGTRVVEGVRGGVNSTDGNTWEHVVEFNWDSLPTGSTDGSYSNIPANSILTDAFFEVVTPFVGGTSYDIDLVDSAAAAIGTGTDKLWDALITASINATGERNVARAHAGTNSGNALDGTLASAGFLKVTAVGTFTAGRGRVVIRYIPPLA